MKRLFYIIFIIPKLIFSQAPGCPDIQVANATVDCNNPCVDLIAEYLHTGETTNYQVDSITYNPPYPFTGGTSAFVGTDDIFSGIVNIPFDFCFYGNIYNQLVVGANGLISFDISLANMNCNWSYSATIPSSPTITGPYENSIHGAYLDINPAVGGDINYATLGTAPCRTFVVNFNAVPDFGCNNQLITQQIVIYETTNAIEVYIENKPTCISWNSGNAIIGIQNIGATQGICPPNRNTGSWAASQEAWRFTPNGTSNYIIEWFDNNGVSLGSGDTLNVCTQNQTNYTAQITYTSCNGNIVTDTAVSIVSLIGGTNGQISNLGLPDTIKSCNSNVTINAGIFDTYLWSTGETTSSITVTQSGNYILEITQGGCDGDDTVLVSIVNANIVEEDTTICESDNLFLTIEKSNTFINWSTSENTDTININPTISTLYWVEISDGVTICRDSVQIIVNPMPKISINGINEICFGESALINLEFNGNPPYNINLNGINQTYTENHTIIISPENTTTYTVDYINDVNCINDTNKIYTLTVNPLPKPIITPAFYEVYPDEEIELNVGNYTYYWWYDNYDTLLSENKLMIVDSTLSVYVIVEDENGCVGKSENAIIEYIPRVILHIPNIFTPNGDEHNELFVIKGDMIAEFKMSIFNRWGTEVFKTNDIYKFWDGKYNKSSVPEGIYTYYIEIIGIDKRYFSKSGEVSVIY